MLVNVCDDKNVLTFVKMTICHARFHPVNVFALVCSMEPEQSCHG